MPRSRLLPLLAIAVLILALAHWIYWYAAAERPGRPDTGSLASRVFLDGDLPYRLWLPHPHQNVARLEGSIGSLDGLIDDLGRLRGTPDLPRLPAFGGLRLPPSTELAIATDDAGMALVAAAEVYPLVGLLSRWAGRLAGNPLLAGGTAEVGGREVEVRWRSGTWLLTAGGGTMPGGEPEGARRLPQPGVGEACLAGLRLDRRSGRLPAGDYRLVRRRGDLELTSGDPARVEALGALAARRGPLPLVRLEGTESQPESTETARPGTAGFGAARHWRAFALIPGLESLGGLPGAVAVHRGSEGFSLPGERVAETIGVGVRTRQSSHWQVRALDRSSLERGDDLGRFVDALEPQLPLELALWIELRSADRLTEQVVEALEAVPIVGRREAGRWRVAESLLARLAGFDRLTVLVSPSPVAVHARLWSVSRLGEN
ncbi:MAG: hypothetical protein R3244_10880 [Thermoanaerobaculia bacterium]|nr:hypothetical protein [Thermoanaerobaculia bacterium]